MSDAAGAKKGNQKPEQSNNEKLKALKEKFFQRFSEEEDEDKSSEESEAEFEDDMEWNADNTTVGTTASNAPTVSAITVRNKPLPKFISVEEEALIKEQINASNDLSKKMKKAKKLVKRSMKYIQQASAAIDELMNGFEEAANPHVTDKATCRVATAAKEKVHAYVEGSALLKYNAKVCEHILDRIQPVRESAKNIKSVGSERKAARDKRMKIEANEIDMSDEAQYAKLMEARRDFDEKDANYKDEFQTLRDFSSSQLGHMLKCYLNESANYLEGLAMTMRNSARSGGSVTGSLVRNSTYSTPPKNYHPEADYPSAMPALANNNNKNKGNASRGFDDRLTAKPYNPSQNRAYAGIPMTPERRGSDGGGYGTSAYSKSLHQEKKEIQKMSPYYSIEAIYGTNTKQQGSSVAVDRSADSRNTAGTPRKRL